MDRLTYTIPEAAEVLGIGRTSLYALVNSGELPTIYIGRRRLVTREALESFVARRSGATEVAAS